MAVRKGPAQKALEQVQNYRSFVTGNATQEEARAFLADLAEFTGYYKVSAADTPADRLKFAEGRRSVFARILASMRMSDAEIVLLEERARQEALSNN